MRSTHAETRDVVSGSNHLMSSFVRDLKRELNMRSVHGSRPPYEVLSHEDQNPIDLTERKNPRVDLHSEMCGLHFKTFDEHR